VKYKDPLKQILSRTIPHWNREESRPAVSWAYGRALQCRTPALGGEVYSSENQELIFYHTCKSRACPSCGYRSSVQWLRERWAALPDALYKDFPIRQAHYLTSWSQVDRNRTASTVGEGEEGGVRKTAGAEMVAALVFYLVEDPQHVCDQKNQEYGAQPYARSPSITPAAMTVVASTAP
jgi:hypothetical protein